MQSSAKVLIVGAGPAGLALAIELGIRGVPCTLIERNDRVGYAPRAKTTNIRTREHLRRWGIAKDLAAASPFGVDYPSNVVFATRLSGRLLARFENALFCSPARDPRYAEHSQWIPQYKLEEVLRAHAASLPSVTIRFSMQLESFEQDAAQVRARVTDLTSGKTQTISADYLVGADGSRSVVRTGIGATMSGERGLSRNYNIVLHAPGLAQKHALGPAIMYWLVNDERPSFLGPMDTGDKWFFMPTRLAPDQKLSDAEAVQLMRQTTGVDCDYAVLSSDEWFASRLIADRYRDKRVFLAGDACHLHPPFGGYGMNMGIADSVDLGWKLAAVLQGWGDAALLDSYEIERRPVHEFVMDEAVANHAVLSNNLAVPGIEEEGAAGDAIRAEVGARILAAKEREFRGLGVMKGYRYEGSPVIVADGSAPPPRHWRDYVPSAHPGCIAPHAWLADGASLYDQFGWGFTLVAGKSADPLEIARLADAASRRSMPLAVVRRDDVDLESLYGARYALVRPDQHVAWRGNAIPADAARALGILVGA